MNSETRTPQSERRPWNSADVSGLSASEVAAYVQTSTEEGAVHLERKGGRTFLVAGN
ncbi:hypothetical protein SAMN05421858_1758 [Haladaptatus litoreus]|uniref:Uncharacterized protein n=1 Tax=Haladaptatus litoreus TaxID=553468 RepID=A0A1N6YX75_9EURY|nr:hypothetical protein SAMN05421858_1758 [Haladaptatus litoreus]